MLQGKIEQKNEKLSKQEKGMFKMLKSFISYLNIFRWFQAQTHTSFNGCCIGSDFSSRFAINKCFMCTSFIFSCAGCKLKFPLAVGGL